MTQRPAQIIATSDHLPDPENSIVSPSSIAESRFFVELAKQIGRLIGEDLADKTRERNENRLHHM